MMFNMPRRAPLALVALVLAACGTDRPEARTDSTQRESTAAPVSVETAAPVGDSLRADTSTHTTRPAKTVEAATKARSGPRRVMLNDVDLTGVGYDRGSVTAPVVVIEFSDFACPYCGTFARETYPQLEEEYVKTGKVFFKYVPFVAGPFQNAAEATRAAECAAEQDRFWPALDRIFELQREWKPARDPMPALNTALASAGVDTERAAACAASGRTAARTSRANAAANSFGVRVTPSFLVNERPIEGALPIADFRRVVEAALMVAGMKR